MREIGIGIVGGGYMGKAHAVAHAAVGAVFGTELRPRLEMVAARSQGSAEGHAAALGFARATGDWRELVDDVRVEAVVIAAPPQIHLDIVRAAAARRKPVFCEKPLGAGLADAEEMLAVAEEAGIVHMIGFNYTRTPASRLARDLLAAGEIGEITWFRGEHAEDFLADPDEPHSWRCDGPANGAIGDLAPHILNAALALMGPVASVMAEIETVHPSRGGAAVTNDDQAQMLCRFESGAMGHIFASRVATGRKMGFGYEINGTKGAIRFDQEDQNALWLYRMEGPEAERGFRKILTGPAHPDYRAFCQGPGHGTGYQDQIVIEARDFLQAIHEGRVTWPSFRDGLEVSRIVYAAHRSHEARGWIDL